MVELVPKLLRQEMARLAEQDARIDGRGRFEGREITLETDCLYNAEGSAKVTMGKTVVYAGVKFEIRTPWPDRPSEGSLMCGAELRPVAHRKYEPGPPSPESIELGRVVDRGIRESGCIDMNSLCIIPGEKVWGVMIDIHVLSDGGNIFDACGLAAIAALRTAIVLAERFDVGEITLCLLTEHLSWLHSQGLAEDTFTTLVKRKNWVAMREFTLLLETKDTFTLQKGLRGVFTPQEFAEIFEVAQNKCAELRKIVAKKEAN